MEKYIFFDMDGTLIDGGSGTIPSSAMKAVKQAQKKGIKCFICTGRSLGMAREFKETETFDGIIFSNGGGIFYRGRIVDTQDISLYMLAYVVQRVGALNGGYQILTADAAYQNPLQRSYFRSMFNISGNEGEAYFRSKSMRPILEYDNKPIQKIDAVFPKEEDRDRVAEEIGSEMTVVANGGYFKGLPMYGMEIMSKGVSKGTGIRRVLEMFADGYAETYGIGDSSNDIAMMKVCGKAIAMGNGTDDVKAIADFVTTDVSDNGIYNALKHYGMI